MCRSVVGINCVCVLNAQTWVWVWVYRFDDSDSLLWWLGGFTYISPGAVGTAGFGRCLHAHAHRTLPYSSTPLEIRFWKDMFSKLNATTRPRNI